MKYFEELRSQIKIQRFTNGPINLEEHYITEAALDQNKINVFLSHSSKDKGLLKDVVTFFQSYPNVKVYVDKNDGDLPMVTSDETAQILKDRIKECQKFVVLVTDNTPESKWIPWELGLADMAKTNKNIALLPHNKEVAEYLNQQEYLGLYDRIVYNNFEGKEPEWLVKYRYPQTKPTAISLGVWLKNNSQIIND